MSLHSGFWPATSALVLLFALVSVRAGDDGQAGASTQAEPRPSFAEPGISPDGREIALVSGGDIWTVPATGGEARLLVSHAATESRPLFSPDGKSIAFVSTRTGGGDVYVHMLNMSAQALEQLYVDLDAGNHAKDGVVVDVRNNSGGFVNVYAIDVLARRGCLNMTLCGLPTSPARTVLGQRALEKPTILVTNQHSLSDAEDFTEGYRALKLGTVVGEPTSGWIIYTWNAQLIDGSSFRLPRMRVTDSQGRDMELHPRPVDVHVERPLGESLADTDSQLDAAVQELLKQIGAK